MATASHKKTITIKKATSVKRIGGAARKASHSSRKRQGSETADGSDHSPATVTANGTSVLAGNMIRIRMYRIGFGDCFLVSLPLAGGSASSDTHAHILVDCGVHGQGNIGTMAQIVDNIAAATGKKLTLVIATHAHQDHISGFDHFGQVFSTFEIGEVWLPWTWDPNNKAATKLQKKHLALTDQLARHAAALGASGKQVDKDAANAIDNLKGNAHAIALLKSGFGVTSTVRYLKAGDVLPDAKAKVSGLPILGLSVHVLGPPQSEEFLAQMDPPAQQHYLRLGNGDIVGAAEGIAPFPLGRVSRTAVPEQIRLPEDEEKKLSQELTSSLNELAFAIDKARNNESVVTLFIYRGQYLLFPGDAQYGNWRWWLENLEPDDILPRINFFKVPHHGSVNATPKEALEKMSDGGFAAMVSTQSTPWPSIPRVPLMERLSEKTRERIVRSDWLKIKGAPTPAAKTAPPEPATLPVGFTRGELWFDYVIEL